MISGQSPLLPPGGAAFAFIEWLWNCFQSVTISVRSRLLPPCIGSWNARSVNGRRYRMVQHRDATDIGILIHASRLLTTRARSICIDSAFIPDRSRPNRRLTEARCVARWALGRVAFMETVPASREAQQ